MSSRISSLSYLSSSWWPDTHQKFSTAVTAFIPATMPVPSRLQSSNMYGIYAAFICGLLGSPVDTWSYAYYKQHYPSKEKIASRKKQDSVYETVRVIDARLERVENDHKKLHDATQLCHSECLTLQATLRSLPALKQL